MRRMIVECSFENMIIFSRLIVTLKKAIQLMKSFFSGFSFIILKIEGVRLKVEEDSLVKDLKEQFDERSVLFAEGQHRVLIDHYKKEGIWK